VRQPCVYEDLFLPPDRCLKPSSWGMPCDINAICTSQKSTFTGLQFRRWQYWSVFIRLPVIVIASEIREMSRNSNRIWPYSSSRSSKVIDLGVNGKPICDFLVVINCNFSRICYRFRDIHAWCTQQGSYRDITDNNDNIIIYKTITTNKNDNKKTYYQSHSQRYWLLNLRSAADA